MKFCGRFWLLGRSFGWIPHVFLWFGLATTWRGGNKDIQATGLGVFDPKLVFFDPKPVFFDPKLGFFHPKSIFWSLLGGVSVGDLFNL